MFIAGRRNRALRDSIRSMAAPSDRPSGSGAASGGGAHRGGELASGSRDATRMRTAPAGGGDHARRPPLAAIFAVPFVVALALSLFTCPAAELAPRDLPVGVAGPASAARAIQARLAPREGAFEVHRYRDAAAARAAIGDREVYGAFVASPAGVTVVTASAGSPVVARLLREAAGNGAQVRDVAPTTAEDPLGLALGTVALRWCRRHHHGRASRPDRAPSACAASACSWPAPSSPGSSRWRSSRPGLGVIRGSWLANAGVLSLAVLAIAATVAGLRALIGPPGIAVAALLMVLIGNPFLGHRLGAGDAAAPGRGDRSADGARRRREPAAEHRILRRRGRRRPRRSAGRLGATRAVRARRRRAPMTNPPAGRCHLRRPGIIDTVHVRRAPMLPVHPLRLMFRVTARAPASSRRYRWHELRLHRAAAARPSRRRDLRAMRPRPSSRWNASYVHRRNAASPLRRRLPKPSTTVHGRVEILLTGTPRPARGCACTSAGHPGNSSLTIAGCRGCPHDASRTIGAGASASKQPTWARHLTRRSAADASRREPRFTPWREGRHQRARSCPASGRGFGVPPPPRRSPPEEPGRNAGLFTLRHSHRRRATTTAARRSRRAPTRPSAALERRPRPASAPDPDRSKSLSLLRADNHQPATRRHPLGGGHPYGSGAHSDLPYTSGPPVGAGAALGPSV